MTDAVSDLVNSQTVKKVKGVRQLPRKVHALVSRERVQLDFLMLHLLLHLPHAYPSSCGRGRDRQAFRMQRSRCNLRGIRQRR